MKLFFRITAIIAVTFLSTYSFASESIYEQHIAKGIAGIEAANYADAIHELKAALKNKPNDQTATLYLGIAYSRSGDREAETTLKKALSMNPEDPRANLELGILYFSRSSFDEAKDYFENAVRLAPKTDISAKANEYLVQSRRGGTAKRWALNVSVGGQYDSNVIVNSDSNPLPQGISDEADWRAILYLKGRYDLLKSASFESSAGYSFYQSVHADLSDYNVAQHLIELRAAYVMSPALSLKGIYTFEYIYMGGEDYLYAHFLSPSLVISEGKGFSTIIEYRYKDSHFKNSDLFTTNSERTGTNNLIGITQNIPVTASVTARIGYAHDEESAEAEYWGYSGDKGLIGMRFNLPHRIFADLSWEYNKRDYDGINPASGSERKDHINTYSGTITKALSDRYSITIGESYTRNKSNIPLYDYKRALTSIFLNARF